MQLNDLRPHLFTLPDRPDWIPYRTSYYKAGILPAQSNAAVDDGEYEVCIDASLEDGHLTYGECYLPGRTSDEF
jgi:aminopeptidase-like protein